MTKYKYGSPDRLDVLQNERVRYTQPAALNDPFELRPFFESIVADDELASSLADLDMRATLAQAYDDFDEATKAALPLDALLALSLELLRSAEGQRMYQDTIATMMGMLRDSVPTIRKQLADGLGTRIGILSLSEEPDSVLMWAHYAADHRGIAIGLDESHPYFGQRRGPNDDFYQLRPVEYREPREGAVLKELDAHEVLLRKSPAWAYEKEWRVLAPVTYAIETVPSGEGDVYLFPLPATAVSEIVLGARSDRALRHEVRRLIAGDPRFPHVRVLDAMLDERRGRITISG